MRFCNWREHFQHGWACQLGFDAIKTTLRREMIANTGDLRIAMQTTNYSIPILVLIRARNIIWDELKWGVTRHLVLVKR